MALAFWRRLQPAYAKTFLGVDDKPHPNAQKVLEDLKRYCGVDREGLVVSPVSRVTDPFATVYRAGRRDVYLRIMAMLTTQIEEPDNGGRSDDTPIE